MTRGEWQHCCETGDVTVTAQQTHTCRACLGNFTRFYYIILTRCKRCRNAGPALCALNRHWHSAREDTVQPYTVLYAMPVFLGSPAVVVGRYVKSQITPGSCVTSPNWPHHSLVSSEGGRPIHVLAHPVDCATLPVRWRTLYDRKPDIQPRLSENINRNLKT